MYNNLRSSTCDRTYEKKNAPLYVQAVVKNCKGCHVTVREFVCRRYLKISNNIAFQLHAVPTIKDNSTHDIGIAITSGRSTNSAIRVFRAHVTCTRRGTGV